MSSAALTGAWSPAEMAGRLVELSGPARLSLAFSLVLAAQQKREPVAFVRVRATGLFFPKDAADSGVDLAALPIVTVADARAAGRAGDLLLRSGAFGLVVLDLGRDCELPMPLQSRLVGLAHKHGAVVVCLTEKNANAASLSSLVSLRAETWRDTLTDASSADAPTGRLRCGAHVLKDKHRGPGWIHEEVLRGPPGLH